jgi:membrane protease YdiL (CAAX protease family)
VPTRFQAIVVWVASGGVMLAVTALIWTIASAVAVVAGVDPRVLANPSTSPLLTSALSVAGVTFFAQATLVGSLAVAISILKPARREVLPVGRPGPRALLGAVLVVFGLWPFAGVAAEVVRRVLDADLTGLRIVTLAARDANWFELLLLYFTLAVVPALGEESMFRGFITAPFLRGSRVAGTLIPALMFGVFHVEPVQVAATIVLGVGFGLARVYSGSIVPGALAHCAYNAAVITLARSGLDGDDSFVPWWVLGAGGAVFVAGFWLLARSAPATVGTGP